MTPFLFSNSILFSLLIVIMKVSLDDAGKWYDEYKDIHQTSYFAFNDYLPYYPISCPSLP